MNNLVLASASPRRIALMQTLGLPFSVEPADVDESVIAGESGYAMVERLARQKAQLVARHHTSAIVVGADTTVMRHDQIFGKPDTIENAYTMLRLLRDGPHVVATGLAVVRGSDGMTLALTASSTVVMRAYTDDEIEQYLTIGESLDKAGAYAGQGFGRSLIHSIDGALDTVVGLPMSAVAALLDQLSTATDIPT